MAAMATAETDAALICLICHNSQDDDKFTSALCGHTFHTYCIDAYADAMGMTLVELPCPTCKRTGDSLADAEASLLALATNGEATLAMNADEPILIDATGERAAEATRSLCSTFTRSIDQYRFIGIHSQRCLTIRSQRQQ